MITLTPNSAPVDISHAKDIIALVGDPKAAAARLKELTAALEAAQAAEARVAALQKEVSVKLAKHETAAEIFAGDKAEFTAYSDKRGKELAELSDQLAARSLAQDRREKAHFDAVAEHDDATKRREQILAAREKALIEERTKFDADRAALDRKLAKARELIQA